MGEVVPREYTTNALPTGNHLGTLSSPEFRHVQEALQEVLIVEHAMEGSAPTAELLREEEEEEEEGEEES